MRVIEEWLRSEEALHRLILENSRKESGAFAHVGYGIDQSEDELRRDFGSVRGTEETNSVVQKLVKESEDLRKRRSEFIKLISTR